jgi:hypothetical protein
VAVKSIIMVKFILGGSMYEGNFKSMKRKRVIKDPPTGTEKKGFNRSLFSCCGAAVKALRVGFENLLPHHTDALFTSRLMEDVIHIYKLDEEGEPGKKAILFSRHKPILLSLKFKKGQNPVGMLQRNLKISHSDSRTEATLILNDFVNLFESWPASACYYRVYHHLSVISDYVFSEETQKYVAVSGNSGLNGIAFSDYTSVFTKLNGSIAVSLPEGTVLTDADTVIHCVGFEFYYKSGSYFHEYIGGSGIKVVDVF